ncbi:hypothetical protein AcW1_001174 [Taiwanofungus camphoratus]|nr:hypothetical protein AcW2_000314 [Antrodia cinnamomea]KAI0937113.1 hypothetical protein AcV5_005087 [Antrodia cinnamomea]KAI0964331.1 hypothetical protein AcW1_001174 [Antrodia cinnamomea]
MLNLSNLRSLLSQVLSLPALHTVVLFTPEGQLVSFAADVYRSKDNVRVVVGLSSEVWQETKEQGMGMVDSELGRVLVLPVEPVRKVHEERVDEPLMLLALNAEDSISWSELENKARELAKHLAEPVLELRGRLSTGPILLISPRAERTAR